MKGARMGRHAGYLSKYLSMNTASPLIRKASTQKAMVRLLRVTSTSPSRMPRRPWAARIAERVVMKKKSRRKGTCGRDGASAHLRVQGLC
eukprot:4487355-Pyramimonas_sp.AAC.1